MLITERFKEYYLHFNQQSIEQLDQLYSEDIVFSDPVHTIEGRANVQQYFSHMCANLTECQFTFQGETITNDSAWFKWVMDYRHPRLNQGKPMQLQGATYIRYDHQLAKIKAHEDFYDMGSMLYEHTPVVGYAIRWLKRQLAKVA